MTREDMAGVNAYLTKLYKDKFPLLEPEMSALWYEELKPYVVTDVYAGIKRWARQHRPDYAPTLHGLVDSIELHLEGVEAAEEQRKRLGTRAARDVSYADLLAEAADRHPTSSTATWGHCHVLMIREGLGVHRLEDTAKRCEEFGLQYPEDAWYWRQEADWWRGGAHGVPYFGSYRPGYGQPDGAPTA